MTQYDLDLIHELDLKAQMAYCEEKGIEKGREEGRNEGLEEGYIEAAKAFIKSGATVEQVARILNLSEDKVSNLL